MSNVIDIEEYRRAKLVSRRGYSAPENFGGLPAHDFKPGDKITVSGLRLDQERRTWNARCTWVSPESAHD